MGIPKNRFGYNEFPQGKRQENVYSRPAVVEVNPETLAALEELEQIATWGEFVEACERQQARIDRRGY